MTMPTTITKEYTAYTYAELDEQAKQHVYDEHYRDVHFDAIKSDWEFWLEGIGLSALEIHYDIGFCQGDGVGFEGSFDMSDVTDSNFDPIMQMLWKRTEGTGRFTWPEPAKDGQVTVERAHHQLSPECFGVEVTLETDDDFDGTADEDIAKAVKEYLRLVGQFFYRYATDQILDSVKWLDDYLTDSDDDGYLYDENGRVLYRP